MDGLFSIIVPTYNRPDEVDELLDSLARQTYKNFELVIVEDGSTEPCKDIVERYADRLNIRYFYKENSGPGDSRNYGMERARGNYLIFFDSDCLIPEQYMERVHAALSKHGYDAYGGPDDAHPSFSDTQKAINYAMTSFITTGGIRGGKKQLDRYQPRSFNMGVSREVYEQVGGFSDIHPGEDPDWSFRIMKAGFKVNLIPEAYVYHKRRIDFKKFRTQVYKFGVVRIILSKWHPNTMKLVYTFPSLFLLGSIGLLALAITIHPLAVTPLLLLALLLFLDALGKNKNIKIAFLAVLASFVQLYGYGSGFLRAFWNISVLRREERKAFPRFFFKR